MENNIKKLKIKELFLIAIIFVLFVNLIKSWDKLNDRLQFIKDAKLKLVAEQKKQDNLKRELAKTLTYNFIEKQAREKLNMNKEGEMVVLLPTPNISLSPTPTPKDTASNFQKWMRLFL